jgi:hypothetical protein
MKKITILIALMISSLGFSQSLLLGMEATETGGVVGNPFGAMLAPILETGTGTNTSRVLKIVGNTTGEVWQGINLKLTSPVGLTTTKTMTIDVLSSTPITFLVKVNEGSAGSLEAAAAVTHNGNGLWQTLSFTFNTALDSKAATANGVYNNFVIHAYWKAGETLFFPNVTRDVRTFYVDNISGPEAPVNTCANGVKDGDETDIDCGGSCTACDVDPTTAAPVPPNRNAGDVKSFFSNKYTNIPIDTWSASWDDSDVTDVQIAGDDTKKILFKNFLGIDFSSLGKHQDLTAMTHFHMDFWTTNPNLVGRVLNVKLVDFGGTDEEKTNMLLNMETASNPKLESGKWVSVDVPLTAFTAGNSSQIRSDIAQLLFASNLNAVYAPDEALPGGVVIKGALLTDKSKVYVDNIYLYKGTPLATEKFETSNVKMYPNPVKNTLTIEANSTIDKIAVYSILGQEVMSKSPNSNSTTLQTSALQKGTYIIKSTIDGKTATSKFIKE